jgi:hypothetical protein
MHPPTNMLISGSVNPVAEMGLVFSCERTMSKNRTVGEESPGMYIVRQIVAVQGKDLLTCLHPRPLRYRLKP